MVKSSVSENKPTTKSQEYIEDSSSESSSEHLSENASGRKKPNASSNAESTSESEAESDSSSNSKGSSTSSGTNKSTSIKRKPKTSQVTESAKKRSRISSSKPYNQKESDPRPPVGYKSISPSLSNHATEAEKMFSGLEKKQIWHITAPASVPITSIESLDIQAALRGDPILRHKGISYKMSIATSKGEALLLSTGVNNRYAKATADVSRNFHLREIPDNDSSSGAKDSSKSNIATEKPTSASDTQHHLFFAQEEGEKKSPRKQPAGLLMRYRPYGGAVEASKPYRMMHPNDTDDEENPSISNNGLVVPAEIDDISIQTPKKKSKKPKHIEAYQEDGVLKEDAMEIDSANHHTGKLTPKSKSQKGEQKPESERKKKKERKGKA